MPDKSLTVDAVVVGAGPAGSAAALELAKAGRDVVIVERGAFPGAKNVYGGVVYGRILDEIVPQWWTEVPVQRWVTRRSTMLMTPTQALTVDYRTSNWDSPPYNGMTTYRGDFDSWLAAKAVAAGARLVTSTVATGLLREADGRISGVRTDRSDGDIRARIVIACDGVNSFLAKEAGLLPRTSPAHTTLGVKETLALPRDVINERFGLVGDQGLDIEMVGCTSGIPGGGFLYTNLDTVSVGVVVGLVGLAEAKIRPEELVAGLKAHPAIAPYLRDAELKEYSAHLVPEGGYRAMPRLATDGMLVAGDAASMCLAAGLWLEGVNFAIGAGLAAAEPRPRRSRRVTPQRAGWPATGGSWSRVSCSPTTSGCATPPISCSPTGCSGITPGWPAISSSRCSLSPIRVPSSAWPGSSSGRSASTTSGCGIWPRMAGRPSGHSGEEPR